LTPASGIITGTPTTAANVNLTFRVTDSGNPQQTAQRAMPLAVLTQLMITSNSPLPAATAGVPYTQTLIAAGGTPNYTWSLASGALPTGIVFPGGTSPIISGTTTQTGLFNFTIRVVDSSSPQNSVS